MKKDIYRRTATTVSLIHYHFVFCPRYRRKLFLIPGVEDYFKEIVPRICKELDIEILAMECHVDHVHLFVSAPPKLSPSLIMSKVKGACARQMRQRFPDIGSPAGLWSRSYFVSTAGSVSTETIQEYVNSQKTRPATKRERERQGTL